ncbi:MAG: ATP-NAD kinase family protein [Candidatus Thorarchaeota archaeon]
MKIGLLVNPIAGMGGRVGLKGTDGVYERAVKLGAVPVAPQRAQEFLTSLKQLYTHLERVPPAIVTCPSIMGQSEVESVGLHHETIDVQIGNPTSSEDTRRCVNALYQAGVRLLVFVGGDGTARDIVDAVQTNRLDDLSVIGVPSGVKMYSGVFVVNPAVAADVVRLVDEGMTTTTDFEVMDADEQSFREDQFVVRLYGFLRGPLVPARFQGAKQVSPETVDEREAQEAIARYVVERMVDGDWYILGPGTTVRAVADLLGIRKTVLGVDLYQRGKVYNDVNESQILQLVSDFSRAWIIVSPIGHQGMLFGRGNQQISPAIIERVGRDHIVVMMTAAKLRGISGDHICVDTGDPRVDEMLRGYIRVITDYAEIRLVRVE